MSDTTASNAFRRMLQRERGAKFWTFFAMLVVVAVMIEVFATWVLSLNFMKAWNPPKIYGGMYGTMLLTGVFLADMSFEHSYNYTSIFYIAIAGGFGVVSSWMWFNSFSWKAVAYPSDLQVAVFSMSPVEAMPATWDSGSTDCNNWRVVVEKGGSESKATYQLDTKVGSAAAGVCTFIVLYLMAGAVVSMQGIAREDKPFLHAFRIFNAPKRERTHDLWSRLLMWSSIVAAVHLVVFFAIDHGNTTTLCVPIATLWSSPYAITAFALGILSHLPGELPYSSDGTFKELRAAEDQLIDENRDKTVSTHLLVALRQINPITVVAGVALFLGLAQHIVFMVQDADFLRETGHAYLSTDALVNSWNTNATWATNYTTGWDWKWYTEPGKTSAANSFADATRWWQIEAIWFAAVQVVVILSYFFYVFSRVRYMRAARHLFCGDDIARWRFLDCFWRFPEEADEGPLVQEMRRDYAKLNVETKPPPKETRTLKDTTGETMGLRRSPVEWATRGGLRGQIFGGVRIGDDV